MASELVCDVCGNREDVSPTAHGQGTVEVQVKEKTVLVSLDMETTAGNDMCNRCRATALRQAAKQLHSTSTRKGRKKGKTSDGKGKGKTDAT